MATGYWSVEPYDPKRISDFEAFYQDYLRFCGSEEPESRVRVYQSLKAAGYSFAKEPILSEDEWGPTTP